MMRGFDSIESMNAEELLVKRKRGSKRFIVAALVLVGSFFLVGILVGYFSRNTAKTQPRPKPTPMRIVADDYILQHVSDAFIKTTAKDFSSKPRAAGTKDNYALAKAIHTLWKSKGLDDVHLNTYNVLLSFSNVSNPNKVELFNTSSSEVIFTTAPFEPSLRSDDATSTIPSFNAFSPPGNISGDVVYVNYGRTEDLQYLVKDLSIDLTGKIFLIRLGKIFRWTKVMPRHQIMNGFIASEGPHRPGFITRVRNAEHFNASAIILYSDPSDINTFMEDKDKHYPHSWWMPDTGVQQGTLLDEEEIIAGLAYPAAAYAYIPKDKNEKLPKIPCQPVSYGFALKILSNMSGPLAPSEWQGNLPTDYRIGPGWTIEEMKVCVVVNNYLQTQPINNVIGVISGEQEPDRYVILGSHHDSWSVGAADPHFAGAALSQIASIFGDLLKKGYRPRRTLIFCSWDAEESGSRGSKEWVKDHMKILQQRAVAYLNVDLVAEGNFTLEVQSSPLLQDSIYEAVKKVPSPENKSKTLYDLWLDRPNTGETDLQEPHVSHSFSYLGDHTPFYSRAGVSTANIYTTFDKHKYNMSTYPLYHSGYDTVYLYESFQDPGLHFTVALTKLVALWANDLVNSPLIPFKVTRLSSAIDGMIQDIVESFRSEWEKNEVNIDGLTTAVQNFTEATKQFEKRVQAEKDWSKIPLKLRMYNDQMMQLDKLFTNPDGLPDMPSFRNILFAPDRIKTDTGFFFPGITRTMAEINEGKQKWQVLKQQVSLTTFYIQRAARFLDETDL